MKTPSLPAVVAFAGLLAGCAGYESAFLSSGPAPRVEDCALIQQATPTKYVCGGKTYTSAQLTEIRTKPRNTGPGEKKKYSAADTPTSGTILR